MRRLILDRREAARVRVAGPLADHDAGALHAPVRVAVDDGDEHLRRAAASARRRLRSGGSAAVGGGAAASSLEAVVLGTAAHADARPRRATTCRDEADHASPGSPATGSGSSSANGTRLPPAPAVRHRWEKKRVIRTPARNSPRRGSGRSPFASGARAQGSGCPRRAAAEKPPPKRGLTSVTGSDPSGSRKHWTLRRADDARAVSATRRAVLDQLLVLDRHALDRLAALRLDHRPRDRVQAAALEVAEEVDRELLAAAALLHERVDRSCSRGRSRARRGRARGRCGASRSPRAP